MGVAQKSQTVSSDETPIPTTVPQKDIMEYQDIHIPYGHDGVRESGRYRILLEILRDWVDSTFSELQKKSLVAWIVDTDTMEPALGIGNLVLIDTSIKMTEQVTGGGIYAFRAGGHVVFRRIFRRLDGDMDMVNENRAYVSSHENLESLLSKGRTTILGRVVFSGKKI